MAACIVSLKSLLPDCLALTSVAGVRDFSYFCRRADITAVTTGTDGLITAVTITSSKLKKFQGRKFQNSGAFELAKNAVGKTRFKHTFNARVYHRSQADRAAMEQLAIVEDLVVFSPNNDNQIEIYGLSLGLAPTSGKGGTGIKLDDDNTALFTFEGEEPRLPAIYNTVTTPTTEDADFLANIAVLDAFVGA
jgi:hypothetical protein